MSVFEYVPFNDRGVFHATRNFALPRCAAAACPAAPRVAQLRALGSHFDELRRYSLTTPALVAIVSLQALCPRLLLTLLCLVWTMASVLRRALWHGTTRQAWAVAASAPKHSTTRVIVRSLGIMPQSTLSDTTGAKGTPRSKVVAGVAALAAAASAVAGVAALDDEATETPTALDSLNVVPPRPDLPVYTLAQVKENYSAEHGTKRLWVTFRGGVYDVTEFIPGTW